MKKEFPVYDICKFTHTQEEDVIIKPFAPYLKTMRKLHFPHRHDFYHMVFFTKGGGSHAVDFETFGIKPYHVYFMAPGQVHGWSFEGEVDGYVVNFSTGFFKSFLLDSQYLDNFPFFSGNVQYSVMDVPAGEHRLAAIQIMEKAVAEAESTGKFRLDTLRVLLLEFFLQLVKLTAEDKANNKMGHNNAVLRSYEKLIEQNYKSHRLPKFYAGLLSITPSHLNAICKELLGISAGDVIRNRIVLEAKRMLVNLDLTVTQVAYGLNFDDNSYFCKFFKNQTGISPETFRKNI